MSVKKNDIHQSVEELLTQTFEPNILQVDNESHLHGGPAQDSHFKVLLVTDRFESMALLARHRWVYQVLAALMSPPIKALALHTYTLQEWSQRDGVAASPSCRGGGGSVEGEGAEIGPAF